MKREFLINIIFLLTANLLIKPFYLFGIDRTVQNTVEGDGYGLYFTLFNFTFIFQIVNDFGIQNFNNRNIAQHRHLIDKYFPNILVLKAGLGIVFFILILLFGWLFGYAPEYTSLLALIGFNQLLNSLMLFLRSNVSGLGHYRLDSLLSIMDRLLLIVLCGAMLWGNIMPGPFQIEWFIWAQTIALGSTCLLAFGIVRRYLGSLSFRYNRPLLLLLLKRSAPYALSIFLMTAYYRLDGIMIEQLLPDGITEAALYATAYRLYEASNMIGFLFASLLLPIFSRMLSKGESTDGLALLSYQLITSGAIALFAGVFFFRTPIMEALYDSGSSYSGRILLYLCASFVAVAGTYIFGTLLVANGDMRRLNYIFASGLGINLLLNALLIPTMKAEGAAIATCGTQFFVLTSELYLARKVLKTPMPPTLWLKLGVYLVLLLLIGQGLIPLLETTWYWTFGGILALGGLIAILLRLIDLRELLKLREA